MASYGFLALSGAYWVLLALGWRRKRWAKGEERPPVSVLVPAHNAASTLPALLESLTQQAYPAPWEIWVIADRCSDATEAVVRAWQAKSPCPLQLVQVRETPPGWSGKKYALYRGLQAARHTWCVVVDADVVAPEGWLTDLMAASEGKVAVIAPAWIEGGPSWASQLASYEAALVQAEGLGWAAWGAPYLATGRGWAVRKSWLLAGLFAWRGLLSGDDDLTLQLIPPQKVGIARTASRSPAPRSFRAAFLRKWRHLQTAPHYPWTLQLRLGIAPALQLAGLVGWLLAPQAWPALLLPPTAKLLALTWMHAPIKLQALLYDWPLFFLQGGYPLGALVRKRTWALLPLYGAHAI